MKGENDLRFSSLVETAAAVHFTPKVSGEVSNERGGLMLVAPPGQLKTTAIEYLDNFPKTQLISNITVKALTALRQDFVSEEIMTMAFPDYDMIYKRHGSTASQVEGTLMSLMGEGFRNPAFSDQRIHVLKARCTIVGGVTIKCYEDKISEWIDSGFARRFLWSRYTVANPEVMEESIAKWKRYQLDGDFILKVPAGMIPHAITELQAKKVLWQLRFQHDRKLPFITAQKIIAVLCWKHGVEKGWKIWDDFVPSLGKDGAKVTI
jgi:hypothetical protein